MQKIKVSYTIQKSNLGKLQPSYFLGEYVSWWVQCFCSYLPARTYAPEEKMYFYMVSLVPSNRRSCQAVNCGGLFSVLDQCIAIRRRFSVWRLLQQKTVVAGRRRHQRAVVVVVVVVLVVVVVVVVIVVIVVFVAATWC